MNVVQIPQPPRTGKCVRGRGLPLRKLGKAARAVLAAEIMEGLVTLTDLSVRQIAAVIGVSVAYISAALKLTPAQRDAVRRGLRPLVEPHARPAPLTAQARLEQIVGEIGVNENPFKGVPRALQVARRRGCFDCTRRSQ
jgi:hypothetical protein